MKLIHENGDIYPEEGTLEVSDVTVNAICPHAATRMDDIVTDSRNPRVFTSGKGATGAIDLPTEFNEFYGSMINMDDPRHARTARQPEDRRAGR